MKAIRKNRKIIIILSLLVITAAMVWYFISLRNISKSDISFGKWDGPAVTENGTYTAGNKIKDSGKSGDFLWWTAEPLKRGSYTVHIVYDAETDQNCTASAANAEKAKFVEASTGILSKNLDQIDYRFEVKKDIDDFRFTIQYNGTGAFSISKISAAPDNNQIKRTVSSVILSVLLADALLYICAEQKNKRPVILSLLGIALLSSLPLVFNGLFKGHDLEVHLMRIEAIVQALLSGQFPARVSSMVLFGYGYPFSIYYNDIFLYLPAVFRLLGFSVNAAYKIYILFINLCKVAIAYFSFKQICGRKRGALIMTLLFSAASYRLTNLYVRAAVGEYTAQIFLPLLALAVKRIFFCENRDRKTIFTNAVILAAAMSGFIGAHIPTTVMSCFILMLICLYFLKKTLHRNTILTLTAAVLFTVLINLYYLVPMADYYHNVPTTISGEVGGKLVLIQGNGAYPAQLMSFFQSVVGITNRELSERLQATPGLPLMAVFLLGIYNWFRGKKDHWFQFILLFSVITIWLSTDIFPWNFLTLHVPGCRILVQMIQFPWRFLEYAVLFLALLFDELLPARENHSFRLFLIIASVLMVIWFSFNLYSCVPMLDFYDTSSLRIGWVGGEEQYVLQGSDLGKISKTVLREGIDEVQILSRKSNRTEVFVRSDNGSGDHRVILPLYNYKGYHVSDENGTEYEIINAEQNRIGFDLPTGFEGTVTAEFRDPPYWTAALWFSAINVLLLIITQLRIVKKRELVVK